MPLPLSHELAERAGIVAALLVHVQNVPTAPAAAPYWSATGGRAVMSDEAIDADGNVRSIVEIARQGGPKKGWRCAGTTPTGDECLAELQACAFDSQKVRPYFRGHYDGDCTRRSRPSESVPGDRGHWVTQGPRTAKWRLQIDDLPGSGPDGRRQPNDAVDGTTTRRARVDAAVAPVQRTDAHTLAGFLDAAMNDALPEHAALPGGPMLPTSVLVVPAAEATEARFAHQERILWGMVEDVRRSPAGGGTMLLLATDTSRIGILIPKDLRGYFPLANDTEFLGRHVMTYGRRIGERPYVKVPSQRGVVFDPPVRVRQVPVTA
ncbi:MAG: hypothetical protein V4737_12395 [Curtobacterium sp.]